MEQKALRLSQIRVFNQLPETACLDLMKHARHLRLQSGEFICHQGDVWPNVIFLTKGELRWGMISLGGREQVLFMLYPDDVFWGHSLFDDEPMPASLAATKETEAYFWPRDVILPVLFRHPEAMWEITKIQVETMRRAREIIYGLAFRPVANRLANLLLDSFQEQGRTAVERDLTLNDIAAIVSSSPEVVCRLLHRFQADGILEVTRAHITLRDMDALAQMVEIT
jgi:CRP/FNR family transcriptional regulator